MDKDANSQLTELRDKMRAHFASGATLSRESRLAALQRLENCLNSRQAELAAALHADLGKSAGEAYLTETGLALGETRYLARNLRAFMKPRRVRAGLAFFPGRCYVRPEPLGLCLIMAPWNYPAHLSLIPLADALAAGNCVVLKPSSRAPATAAMLEEIAAECFAPEHVSVLLGSGETLGAALLQEAWDFIFYTGSLKVGREVMAAAAENLTPLCLELGGKSPAIVLAGADLALAARRIAWGKTLNAGQTCVAPDYLLAEASIKDELCRLLRREFARFPGEGAAALANPDYCRIVSAAALDRLVDLSGGQAAHDPAGLRLAPLVMDTVAPEDKVMQEEVFGPLLPVLPVSGADAAAEFVRARPKPLACYLFGPDTAASRALLARIPCGGAAINDTAMQVAAHRLPFGGVGASGLGRYHGRAGFDLFSNLKGVLERGVWCDPPLRRLPVSTPALRLIKKILG